MAKTDTEIVESISLSQDAVFPIIYEYPDISVAWLFCTYLTMTYAVDVCLMGLKARLAELYDPSSPTNRGDPLLPFDASGEPPRGAVSNEWGAAWDPVYKLGPKDERLNEMTDCAHEICKSAEYLSRAPFLDPLFLIFSLRMALRMPIARWEKDWVLEKSAAASESMGLAMTEEQRYHVQQVRGFGVDWEAGAGASDKMI